MMAMADQVEFKLLQADEPPPCQTERDAGQSNFFILVDHASARIPRTLNDLGVPAAELSRHIAWDIGALAVARRMSQSLDATLVWQSYSRLVIDCNRDPLVESSIPTVSEHTNVPGNLGLNLEQREARRREIFGPYHARISGLLDARVAAHRPTFLVAQHSMTPQYKSNRRDMHAAILYNRDRRFASILLNLLRRDRALHVADNEPYFVSDATDYSIPQHGEARRLPHVEIEIRQDLIAHEAGQIEWAERLTQALSAAELEYLRAYPGNS
jgi:predicted N-formylglutamate amidohydrolase